MKIATYKGKNGKKFEVKYDPYAPCICCGKPVMEASMGGTLVCPSCDCGYTRDGRPWTYRETIENMKKMRGE